jgi:prophage regulatory protein
MEWDISNEATLGRLLRLPEVVSRTGKARSTIYRDVKAGAFPAPVQIGERSVAWREADIVAWMDSLRTAGPER